MKKKFLSPAFHLLMTWVLAVLFFLNCMTGCTYYKVITKTRITSEDLRKEVSNMKYLVLHSGDSVWNFLQSEITDTKVTGIVSGIPDFQLQHIITSQKGGRYNHADKDIVLKQVNLYLHDSLLPEIKTGDKIEFDFTAVSKMETYNKNKGKSTATWLVPVVVVPIVAVGVMAIVAVATSCPFIYVNNDNGFEFTGEIFGGAVYSSLERHDYLPLPAIKPSENQYTLKISNKLAEIQHINLAELWIVSHPENVTVLPDRYGSIHTVNHPVLPIEAYSSANKDLLPLLSTSDQNCFLFDEEPSLTGDTNAFNSVVMTFTVPSEADTGKLVIKAGNSLWGDYTYGEFMKLFGNKYDKWVRTQGNVAAEKNIQWKMDQRFVLMVYLETNNGWQFIDYFDLIGPMGDREMIMPIALEKALFSKSPTNDRMIRIKLESGFKFWELDYAAVDFSENSRITIDYMQPVSATTESGKDVTHFLTENDNNYYVQKNTGEEGVVIYNDSPGIPGMKKSVFLNAKGYYEHVRDYQYPPDKELLLTFRIPGRLSQFSFLNYKEFIKAKAVLKTDPEIQ
jgi:hypothetical protein